MVDLLQAWALLSTVGAGALGWLWYRNGEVIRLAKTVYAAAVDKEVTEEEFQLIAADLGKVLYKKGG